MGRDSAVDVDAMWAAEWGVCRFAAGLDRAQELGMAMNGEQKEARSFKLTGQMSITLPNVPSFGFFKGDRCSFKAPEMIRCN